MGSPSTPPPVRFVTSVITQDRDLLDQLIEILEAKFGPIHTSTKVHGYAFSPSYAQELGDGLLRQVHVFAPLRKRDLLPDYKLSTNELEQDIGVHTSATSRRVNVDPGYLDASHLILASTKRYHNRVYLREGIYADMTLYYNGQTFKPFRFAFPEYRIKASIQFFNHQRLEYLDAISDGVHP
jgi:hypothetical protein